jgi:hypothetical protein
MPPGRSPDQRGSDTVRAMPPAEQQPDFAKAVEERIHTLLSIKARLPFLLALAEELARIGGDKPVRNDIVLKMANDSFDLMVIDLASLREGMTNGDGSTMNRLAERASNLRRLKPEDCDPQLKMAGGRDPIAEQAIGDHVRTEMAAWFNRAFDRLFPAGEPVIEAHVKDLIARFRKDTEATDRDRNRVRAHRYERAFDPKHRQDLREVEQQVGVFERYLGDLFAVLTKSQYSFHAPTWANVDNAATDVADLIVVGSINQATLEYGVVGAEPLETDRLYWLKRQQFYEQIKGQVSEDGPAPQ